jgi:hypothetical protein
VRELRQKNLADIKKPGDEPGFLCFIKVLFF